MPTLAKPPVSADREISAAGLLAALAGHADKALVFSCAGRDVRPGYHVTEVKSGRFEALDCGGNPEAWQETFIQLWDVPPQPGRDVMRVGKFVAIMRKVSERIPYDAGAKLTFEVSDGTSAIRIMRASAVEIATDAVRVALEPRPASCKPRDRWLVQEPERAASGCCASARAQACCG
jgi:hypothetical protein